MKQHRDDPRTAAYWLARMVTADNVQTLAALRLKLCRMWEDTKERRVILEQITRRAEELARRN